MGGRSGRERASPAGSCRLVVVFAGLGGMGSSLLDLVPLHFAANLGLPDSWACHMGGTGRHLLMAGEIMNPLLASVIKQKAFAAGLYSVVIYLLIGSGVVAFSSSAWYVLPAAVGGFAGTYLTVKWQARSAED